MLREVLERVDLVATYRALETRHAANTGQLRRRVSDPDVLGLLTALGYDASYDRRERFFKIVSSVGATKVQLNLALPGSGHVLECILFVDDKKRKIRGGGPFTLLVSHLTEGASTAKRLPFSTKDELSGLLAAVMELYERIAATLGLTSIPA